MGQEKIELKAINPFNSPLEVGMRVIVVLVAAYPRSIDLQRLVNFDYLILHSGDAGGPESLHAPLPLRSGELLVRRGLIEKGLLLMFSRSLLDRNFANDGFVYSASETAGPFLEEIQSSYFKKLRERAEWVVDVYGDLSDVDLHKLTNKFFETWSPEFQHLEAPKD